MSSPEQDKKIIDQFKTLPEVIQDAITESGWEQKIRVIAQKNNLAIGDAATLEVNTFLVMLGLLRPDQYAETLKQEIAGLDKTRIDNIISAVEEEIFKNIRQTLIALEEKKALATESEQVPDNLPTGDAVAGNSPIVHAREEITRESVAKEMEGHVEILPAEEAGSPGFPMIQPTQESSENVLVKEKLEAPTETQKETVSYNLQTIDPYREILN